MFVFRFLGDLFLKIITALNSVYVFGMTLWQFLIGLAFVSLGFSLIRYLYGFKDTGRGN